MKYYATITSNIDSDKMNFRVNLTEFTGFYGNQEYLLNFRASFEATAKSSVLEVTLNKVIDNEELHKDRLKTMNVILNKTLNCTKCWKS